MTWTTPRTWADEELVTANLMNTHIRDNLNALKSPPSDNYEANEASDYTTTSTSFVDLDATKFSLTITTTGGDVLVGFNGNFKCTASTVAFLDIDVDGSRVGGDDGIKVFDVNASIAGAFPSFARLITGLSAGTHTFKLQWRTGSGTLTMYAGAGTSNADVHPQFWVREVS